MDTRRVMSEESRTPELVELVRRSIESANDREFDSTPSFFAPDAVWDMSPLGVGIYKGRVAIRGFLDDWFDAYEELASEPEEILDLGNGVAFSVVLQNARLTGSAGQVQLRYAAVGVWVDGLIVRTTYYTDIDEARAAAERLAEERG
jgi:ketosteroid isomerase-like protein